MSLLILMSLTAFKRVVSVSLGVGFRLFFFTIGQTAAVSMQWVKKPVITHFKEDAGSGSRGHIEDLSRFIASVRPVESTVEDCLRPPTLYYINLSRTRLCLQVFLVFPVPPHCRYAIILISQS